ncbi:PAS domain S-box protein [Sporosarcina sp. Marseille-Q4063]|uniref:two-component system histidine kinase PnpS n=1 Tax=Sporosarcina sp. Marseille-Q4063 TaxID=2810514 RepID=UPI001BB04A54|nr:ATP-binding protein [Sporosarcina sp. Marseille-Q4063]QUW23869.1 PAS domain S-box protein [Sporosarcina sp. Marseille-Q4063]
MKGLYGRLVLANILFLSVLLTGLGIVLGQFFPLFNQGADPIIKRDYLLFLLIVLLTALFVSLYIITRLLLQYIKPIDEVTSNAIKLAEGDYSVHTAMIEKERKNDLSSAIYSISQTMQEISTEREMEKERLNTLIESMGSGLLMFGRGGTLNLVNGVFRTTFGFKDDEKLIGKTVNSLELPGELESLIEDVYMTEQSCETQLNLQVNGVSSSVNVYGAPVIGNYGNWLGIVVVIHDITELVRLEKIRKDFVANVSHELRTPVTSIKGFAETLLDGAMNDQTVMKEFLEIIQKESNRLKRLIDELLVLSDVEREGFTLQYSEVGLKKMIYEAIQVVSGRIEEKDMVVSFDMPNEIVIDGDEGRLIQVMVNLLSNAIIYSMKDTTITIEVKEIEDDVVIIVKDEGIGIKESELERLFERFYRVDRARSRDSGGTGLGLAIVKHLIEVHGGTIQVESKSNVGTSFSLRIPRRKRNY